MQGQGEEKKKKNEPTTQRLERTDIDEPVPFRTASFLLWFLFWIVSFSPKKKYNVQSLVSRH